MLRYLAGVLSALLLTGAGVFLSRSNAAPDPLPAAPRQLLAQDAAAADEALLEALPSANPRTREQKRFDRLDKDRDARITRDEYMLSRRKAFAKLDVNGDGRLGFEEWAIKAATKFASADKDRSGVLNAPEFATTAVVRRARAKCVCPPPEAQAED
jgi:hypothetical protein